MQIEERDALARRGTELEAELRRMQERERSE
jgi:hypothetical protein